MTVAAFGTYTETAVLRVPYVDSLTEGLVFGDAAAPGQVYLDTATDGMVLGDDTVGAYGVLASDGMLFGEVIVSEYPVVTTTYVGKYAVEHRSARLMVADAGR